MMVKKARKACIESSPSSSSYPVGEEAKARLRHQNLMQDYEELREETKAKRKRLLKANEKKLKLLAEIKFLRRKFKSFSENPSLKTPYRVKKQPYKTTSPSVRYAQVQDSVQSKAHLEDRNFKVPEAAVPSTTSLLDLNQVSLPDIEELEEREPLRIDRLKRFSMDGGAMTSDLKLSLCRDGGNKSDHVGRRKISRQNQLPLRV